MQEPKWMTAAVSIALAATFGISIGTQAVKGGNATVQTSAEGSEETGTAAMTVAEVAIPEVPDVTPLRENGVVTAEEWSSYYPSVYASWQANSENTGSEGGRIAYTESDPNIVTLYQGIGFSKDYTEAVGHSYTLEDIANTERPHKLANCLTCKTPDYTALVNELGDEAYSMDFDTVYADMSETVSCYSCHGNIPGTIVIESDYMRDAMQDEIDAGTEDAVNVSCAQCHIEYYFDPETKATKVPYDSSENDDPDSILAYYNEMGFVDFTNENTGVGMIKVQHPEFETYTGEGSVHNGTFNCADCHMGVSYDEDGNAYVNHNITSPLDNQELLDSTCSQCHADLASEVAAIQKETTERETAISDKLVELNTKLAAAVEEGVMTEEELDEIRALDRDAQFYWDFVYVENSEGAHNSKLTTECLDKAESLVDEALAKL